MNEHRTASAKAMFTLHSEFLRCHIHSDDPYPIWNAYTRWESMELLVWVIKTIHFIDSLCSLGLPGSIPLLNSWHDHAGHAQRMH